VFIRVCVDMYVCIRMYVCMYTFYVYVVCVSIWAHAGNLHMCVCGCLCAYLYLCVSMCVSLCVCLYVGIYKYPICAHILVFRI